MKEILREDDNFIYTKEDGVLNIHCKKISNPDELLQAIHKPENQTKGETN